MTAVSRSTGRKRLQWAHRSRRGVDSRAGRSLRRSHRSQRRRQDDVDETHSGPHSSEPRTRRGAWRRPGNSRLSISGEAWLPSRERRLPRSDDGCRYTHVLRSAQGIGGRGCPALLDRVGLSRAASPGQDLLQGHAPETRTRTGAARPRVYSCSTSRPRVSILSCGTEFFEIIRGLTAAGTTVILSSHILTELEARTDLAAIMRDGRLVAFGDIDSCGRRRVFPSLFAPAATRERIAKKLNGAFYKTFGVNGRPIDLDCPGPRQDVAVTPTRRLRRACADRRGAAAEPRRSLSVL